MLMVAQRVSGSKTWFTRLSIAFTGIVLLGLLNYQIIYYVYYKTLSRWQVIGFLILAYIFRTMVRVVNHLKYEFTDRGITIILPTKKTYELPIDGIKKIEHVRKKFWLSGIGIGYNVFTKELFFTTSSKNLLRVTMREGTKILLSPKYIDENFLSRFKN